MDQTNNAKWASAFSTIVIHCMPATRRRDGTTSAFRADSLGGHTKPAIDGHLKVFLTFGGTADEIADALLPSTLQTVFVSNHKNHDRSCWLFGRT
jgi:hypothetical protein